MEFIRFEEMPAVSGKLGCVHLTRCQALNAFTLDMGQLMLQQLQQWAKDDAIFAVVILTDCEHFCAGGDIRELYQSRNHPENQLNFFHDEYQLNYLIKYYPKPVIPLLKGVVMGGGAGISIHASHRVACETLSFAMPETAIGLFPDIGSSYFLNKMPGFLGYYLGLTGTRIHAADAVYAGIVDYMISSNHYADVITALLAAHLDHTSAAAAISAILSDFAITADQSMYEQKQDFIDGIFCADQVSTIIEYLRHDTAEWSQTVLAHLHEKSPMSLTITLEALRRTNEKDLAFCLQQDFTLVQSFLKSQDLYEGIRSVVIDKDRQPVWQPSSLAAISDDEVSKYFDTTGKRTLIFD